VRFGHICVRQFVLQFQPVLLRQPVLHRTVRWHHRVGIFYLLWHEPLPGLHDSVLLHGHSWELMLRELGQLL